MARRAKLRTEKRLTALEAAAKTFEPSPLMRDLTRDEIGIVWATLHRAMSDDEFRALVGSSVGIDIRRRPEVAEDLDAEGG